MTRPFPLISLVARDLGLKVANCRGAAFWRGGKNPRSVTYDDARGCWYDHGKQEGGGIIALVMKALNCDRREAVAWLRRRYGLAKPDAAMLKRRQANRSTAISLAEWRWRLVQYFRAVRNCGWTAWREAERLYRGPERIGDLAACEWQALRRRFKIANGIDSYIDRLQSLSTPDLLALRRRLEAE